MIRHTTRRSLAAAALLLSVTTIASAQGAALSGASSRGPVAAPARTYGDAVKVGDGTARTYVELDRVTGAPTEIGVALSERALEALPTAGAGHHGMNMVTHEFILALPANNKTPFTFVEMNWNPMGHEPDGVYQDVPHFD